MYIKGYSSQIEKIPLWLKVMNYTFNLYTRCFRGETMPMTFTQASASHPGGNGQSLKKKGGGVHSELYSSWVLRGIVF